MTGASDPEDSESESESRDDVCPFCGAEIQDACEHLLANWAADPVDNGGAILDGDDYHGGKLEALDGVMDLALALCDLNNLVTGEETPTGWAGRALSPASLRIAAELSELPWWPDFKQRVRDNGDMGCDWEMGLAELVTPVAGMILEDLPGVELTSPTLGGMTSGVMICLWSTDRTAGVALIRERIKAETRLVRELIERAEASVP